MQPKHKKNNNNNTTRSRGRNSPSGNAANKMQTVLSTEQYSKTKKKKPTNLAIKVASCIKYRNCLELYPAAQPQLPYKRFLVEMEK